MQRKVSLAYAYYLLLLSSPTSFLSAGVVMSFAQLLHSSQTRLAVLCVTQEQAAQRSRGRPPAPRETLWVQSYNATTSTASLFCMSAPGTSM